MKEAATTYSNSTQEVDIASLKEGIKILKEIKEKEPSSEEIMSMISTSTLFSWSKG